MHLIQNYINDIPGIIKTASSVGGTGVHVFFFASGCGLYLSYLRHPMGFVQFIKRRFGKIYLPYIIVVLVSFCLPWMYSGSDRFVALLSHIFLFKMFVPRYESSFGIQLWYLSTLFQLYFAFIPLCKIRSKLNSKQFIIGTIIVSLSWSLLVNAIGLGDERIFNSFFLQFLWEFCLGMEVAKLLNSGGRVEIKKWWLLVIALIGLSLEGLIAIKVPILKAFNDIPNFFGYTALALLCYVLLGSATEKIWKPICRYSYEWYLVHILVFETIFLLKPTILIEQVIIGLVGTVISYFVAKLYFSFRLEFLD